MNLALGIIFLLLLVYVILILFFLWSWSTRQAIVPGRNDGKSSMSVIVPVRNEAGVIEECISSLLRQDYQGDFEIVIVDDHSTDGTPDIIKDRFVSEPNIRLELLSEHANVKQGKKAALAHGIVQASGEIIVTTDGDCMYAQGWLSRINLEFGKNVQIITGPVVYPEGNNMLTGFQSLDLLSLVLATAAGIQSRLYFLGNGANLAFRKSAFVAVNGYAGNENYASGDDLFLIQKILDHFGVASICYIKSPDMAVVTKPENSWLKFLNQRVRWASKNHALKGHRVFFLWSFLWCVNASLLAAILLGLSGHLSLWLVAFLLYAKMMIEGIALYQVAGFFSMKSVMRWFPWSFFLNILYVVVIGVVATVRPSFEWKGRR